MADRRWFAARVRSGHELKMRTRLGDLGIRNYIPSREVTRVRGHKRCKVEAPVIPNLIFLYCTQPQARALANGYGLPLKYLIDHATRTLLEVPTKQLEDFIDFFAFRQRFCDFNIGEFAHTINAHISMRINENAWF